jgi:hypothetical protein
MTQAIAKYAAKKMLSGEMNKYKEKKVESVYVCTCTSSHPPPR